MARTSASYCTRCGARIAPGGLFCPRCGTSIGVPVAGAVTTAPAGPPESQPDGLLAALRRVTLGDYEILAELGRGGMATVYLAHDLALDRKVAIKVLAPALLQMGEGMVERFKREARTAAALSHPHIIPIYAVKESEQVLYFVMQYVAGRALDSIVREVSPLPIPMVQTIIAHVGDALSYAHRHGVIHRDIKSGNIMLDEEGWAVVTDFGIAKVVEAEGLTLTGVTVGTPNYMSPEQCATREVTGASDQYSLGVVAYEMLTGKLPFKGESIMSIMYAHFKEQPRPIPELRPDCPATLATAVMRMLEKDPARRWPSMDDVVATCGRPAMRQDDPIRSQMITLAKAGGRSDLVAQIKTPTSPIPPARPRTRPSAAAPRARPASGRWWALGGAGGVAIGVALWWAAPWRAEQAAPVPTPAARDTLPAAVVAPMPAPVPPSPEPVASRPPTQRSPGRDRDRSPTVGPESVSRRGDAQREDTLVRSLRARALGAMSRAIEAGATPAELARGDTVFRGAEAFASEGRTSEAMVQLATAASLWAEVERLSRARAARDRDAALPPPAAQPPVPIPAADARPQIEAAIATYARALESLDLAEVRRAYPGLTSIQRNDWRQFFQRVRRLKTSLAVTALDVSGAKADAKVDGVYEYVNVTTGRTERHTVTFRATLMQDPTGWRLTTVQ
jgi:serine/threonine protein kinase